MHGAFFRLDNHLLECAAQWYQHDPSEVNFFFYFGDPERYGQRGFEAHIVNLQSVVAIFEFETEGTLFRCDGAGENPLCAGSEDLDGCSAKGIHADRINDHAFYTTRRFRLCSGMKGKIEETKQQDWPGSFIHMR